MGLDLLRKIFGKKEAEAEALVLEWKGLEAGSVAGIPEGWGKLAGG